MKIQIKKYEPEELDRIKKLIETDKTITEKDIEAARSEERRVGKECRL